MLTTCEAARLLGDAIRAEEIGGSKASAALGAPFGAVLDCLRPLGFDTSLPVPPATRRRLGLAESAARVHVAEGPGAIRALLVEWRGDAPLRGLAAELARAVASESPSRLWLLVVRDRRRSDLLIAAPMPGGRGRTAALMVDAGRILQSDAETLAALAGAQDRVAALRHLRWCEILGRDALTRRFYRDFERCVVTLAETATGRATPADRRTVAVLHASRLLFLAFLEAKGWLDGDRAFLRRAFEERAGGRGAHQRFLAPLFFGTLNTPSPRRATAARAFGRIPFLNGGLFTRTPVESRTRALRFTDDAIGALLGDLLGRYRITARESHHQWSEAAVDPEMLGRAFESLMAAGVRKDGGVFYTPQPLIVRLAQQALDAALDQGDGSLAALERVRVLDPACGSGAFLVFALEALAARRAARGDERPLATIRRAVLTSGIFGVDRDPTAVWLCQLRLWLSVVVEDDTEVGARHHPLPNLDRNIREGDALSGESFTDASRTGDPSIESLRLRYVRATGVRKRSLGRLLDREERGRARQNAEARSRGARARRHDLIARLRSRDLFGDRHPPTADERRTLEGLRAEARTSAREARRLRDGAALPFAFGTHFPQLALEGGATVVLGNPPWVRTHRIPAEERAALRARFQCFRDAAWRQGATAAGAGHGFASQADLASLFVERSVGLVRPGGVVALLVPAKLWNALAGGGVRRLLLRDAPPIALETWDQTDGGFDAAVYPSAVICRRAAQAGPETAPSPVPIATADVVVTRHRRDAVASWHLDPGSLALDASPGAPWLLLPSEVRRAFDRLVEAGVPLAESGFGRPMLGVKSGCNAAFLVERVNAARSGVPLERELLRPVLRGEDLLAFARTDTHTGRAILWTHGVDGSALAQLPPGARSHLSRFRRSLEMRSDCRGERWWTLFRTEAAGYAQPRVVWNDIGLRPRALVLNAGDRTVPLNSCYVVRALSDDDAHAFAALLNSDIAAAWLGAIAEPARGGYRRFLGWTCALLPIPREWERARAQLARMGRAAAAGSPVDASALSLAVADAFGLRLDILDPLLRWDRR